MTSDADQPPAIEATFDLYLDGTLLGWAWDPTSPHQAVSLALFLGARRVSIHRADRLRPDLAAAGFGSGRHGFAIPVSPTLAAEARSGGERLAVRAVAQPDLDLFTLDFNEVLNAPPDVLALLSAALDGRGAASVEEGGDGRRAVSPDRSAGYFPLLRAPARIETSTSGPVHERPPLPSEASIGTGAARGAARERPPLFPYAEHVRRLHQLEDRFAPGIIASDLDHFVRWYLDAYNAPRAPLRAPLSADILRWLNEPIVLGGSPHPATRAMLWYLAEGSHGPGHFADDDLYRQVVYWWACEQAPALNVEDCLVTPIHVDALRQIPEPWAGRSFPLSRFMERAILLRPALQSFDAVQSVSARVTAYMVLAAEALDEPGLLRFAPPSVLARLFDGDEPLFDRLAVAACAGRDGAVPLDVPAYRARLARRGFDLDTLAFRTVDAAGHRCEAARLGVAPPRPPVDVQVVGAFSKVSGIAHAARLSLDVLRRTGLSVAAADWRLDNPQPEQAWDEVAAPGGRAARVNLVHLNADMLPQAFAYGPDLHAGAYTIGFFFWELDAPAECHRLGLDLVDEVWVASEYNRRCFATWTDKPVVNVGMALDLADRPTRAEARAVTARLGRAGPDDFIFLTTYDSLSYVARKNPLGVLRAFQDAFPGDGSVRLLIKTHNAAALGEGYGRRVWEEVQRRAAEDPRVAVIDETLPYRSVMALKAGSDCYVSLHRSEGFGFGMLEAMALDVPVVCTAYSGNLDFCDDETAWLVEADEVGVRAADYAHVSPGHRWAEPRQGSAVAALLDVRENAARRAARAGAAALRARGHYGLAAAAARYTERLHAILKTRPQAAEAQAAEGGGPVAPDVKPGEARRTFFGGVLRTGRSA